VALASHLAEPLALAKLVVTLGWTLAVARLAQREGFAHVHANWAHLPATSAWIVSRLTGIPFSFSAHAGRDLFRTEALLARKLAEARFAVACNGEAKRRLEAAGPGRVVLRPHGVDLERFRPRSGSGSGVLSVGNLDPAKGFDVAVEALAALRREGRNVSWRVVGSGPERKRLARLARRLGVSEAFELAGRLEGEGLVRAYAAAAVFAAPSRILPNGGRDGLPNVVLEAMAVGVPVVASAVAALPEIVEDGRTGLLVPPEDPRALARAVARLLDDRALGERLARQARERVERDFDLKRTSFGFASLFLEPEERRGGREVERGG
jgi:glycosyltransferase involved in cell wall biosynthesis